MKRLLILAVLFPVPVFQTTRKVEPVSDLSVPAPEWTADTEVVENVRTVATEEAKHHGPKPVTEIDLPRRGTRLKRLPGPTYWRCPTCGDSTCLMYLGAHLTNPRSHHRISGKVVNGINWQTLRIYHDNLHNAKVKPGPVVVLPESEYCPQCQTSSRRPIVSRLFGRAK